MPLNFRAAALYGPALAALVSVLVAAPNAGFAEETANAENKVVAKVGDDVIRESDLLFMAEDFMSELRRVPEEQRQNILIGALVDMKLMAQVADKEGLAESDAFKTRMSFLRMRALRDAYVEAKVVSAISDENIKARYQKDIADFEAAEEVNARHILVKSEDDAKAVIKLLDDGADFAELAKEKSTGPSGPSGGDLGFFTKGRMVKQFEEAAFAMAAGTYSKEPVKTQFGWHIIKVEERRMQEPPAFDQVKDRIRESLKREIYLAAVKELKDNAKVEVIGGEIPKSE